MTGGAQVENGKLAKAVAHAYYDLLAIDLKSRALALDTDDQRRMAYMAAGRSRTARVLVSGPMERSIRFTNLEFTTAMQCYLGLRCKMTSDIVGESIPTNESRRDYRIDPWGRTLHTAHGWSGDTRHFRAHMELEHAVANDIRSVGSGSMSCSQEVVNLFLPQIPDCDGRSMIAGLSERSMKEVNAGIIPDLVVRSDPHLHGGEPGGLGGTDTLYDIKFLGPGGFYTSSASTKHGAVIESRANRVHTEYLHHAGQIDAKFFKHTSTSPGIGPITKVLSQYPRVKGLGVGAFGEFSTDLEELLELTARARALEYADTYAVPEDRVISAFVWDTRRRWAMTAIRAISRTKIAARAHVLGSASRSGFHRSSRGREGPTSTCDRWDTATAGGDRSFSQ